MTRLALALACLALVPLAARPAEDLSAWRALPADFKPAAREPGMAALTGASMNDLARADQNLIRQEREPHTAGAAEYLGLQRSTIRKWAARGYIPIDRNPVNGFRLFKRSDFICHNSTIAP